MLCRDLESAISLIVTPAFAGVTVKGMSPLRCLHL